jgi:VanZ family protein
VQKNIAEHTAERDVDTGARLGSALLAYMLGVTLIITLLPFHFTMPASPRITLGVEPIEIVANVLLFVPLGFFYALARPVRDRPALRVLVLGALVSVAIESVQYFEPMRTPSPLDVVTNAAGAWIGALAAARVARAAAAGGRLVGWLALELPLMGLVYLLVPLLWVDALSAGDERARMVLAPLLAAFGALLLGGMQRHYFAPVQGADPHRTAAFAALWFLAGAFPALAAKPIVVVIGTLVAAAVCWWRGRVAATPLHANRRFEVPLLKSAAPIYAAYFALIVLLPLRFELAEWTLHAGFSDQAVLRSEILRLLEIFAACTLAGYMVAELRGRVLSRYRDAVPRLLGLSLFFACVVEALWGFRAGHGASIARGALMVAAALYGGWLYYLQRAHVVRLLSQPAREAPR